MVDSWILERERTVLPRRIRNGGQRHLLLDWQTTFDHDLRPQGAISLIL